MVPLDGWCAHPRPVALFREKPAWLSVVMRGNDHVKRELAQALVDAERAALTAQVLRRVAAFEQRTGYRPPLKRSTTGRACCMKRQIPELKNDGVEAEIEFTCLL